MRAPVPERCDVAIVGGGPAGAAMATWLARAGLGVVCFERERFPRFHVGESLLPACMPLFDRLGVRARLEAQGFLKKYGAAFFDETEGREVVLHFRKGPRWEDHAYNVPRAEFDRILLEHAGREGARVLEGAEVRGVRIGPDQVQLQAATDDGGTHTVEAAFLVDATGRDALLASRLGRREPLPGLGKFALFAHYRGALRWPGRTEGHIRLHIFEHGWFWLIPFTDDLTSVGCVLHRRAVGGRDLAPEGLFEAMVGACPGVSAALAGASRVTAVWSAANFSYRVSPAIGDRFLAIGDAVTFIDPIFSTGVYVAMQSAELAAPLLVEQVRSGAFDARRFDAYRRRVERGTRLFVRFIEGYYDPAFLDVFFSPSPPPTLRDAVTTVLAGGAFLGRSPWLAVRLALVWGGARYVRRRRRRGRQTVDSRLSW